MAISTRTAPRRPTHTPAHAHANRKRSGHLRLFAVVLGALGTMAIWNSSRAGAAAPTAEPRPAPLPATEDRSVTGRILDPAGNPARWAVVRVIAADSPGVSHTTTTDLDGKFKFAPFEAKAVRVVADHDSGIVESALLAPDAARNLVLVLVGAPNLHGRVLDDLKRPVTSATVKVDPSPAWFARIATTDNRGQYTLRLVPPGATSVVVWASGFETATVRLRDVQAGYDVTLTRSRPMTGVVVDPWGVPVGGAQIEACESPETERAISERDGTFELPATVVGCPIAAKHARFSSSEPFPIPNRGRIIVRLLSGGSIEGTALDERGRPLSSASVGFETLGGETVDTNLVDRMFDTTRGTFRFDGLSPGTYVLIAKAPDRPDVTTEPIEVSTGHVVRGVPIVFLPAQEPEAPETAQAEPPPPPPPSQAESS
jgi:hypothetical protein